MACIVGTMKRLLLAGLLLVAGCDSGTQPETATVYGAYVLDEAQGVAGHMILSRGHLYSIYLTDGSGTTYHRGWFRTDEQDESLVEFLELGVRAEFQDNAVRYTMDERPYNWLRTD